MFKKDQDLYAGLLCIAVAGVLWSQQGNLSRMQGLFPRVTIVLMALAGVGVIIRAMLKCKQNGKPYRKLTLREALLQAALPGAFLVLMGAVVKKLGFYPDVFIVLAGTCFIEDIVIGGLKSITLKKSLIVLGFSLLCTGIFYVCFNILLKMTTPTGFLGI